MNIFVAGSACNEISEKYLKESEKILNEIFKEEYNLVFGTCENGIMGKAYKVAKNNNKNIIAICTKNNEDNLENIDLSVKMLEENVVLRTNKILEISDIALILPGGIGTLLELFAALDIKRSNEINLPIIIYNIDGFFNNLIEYFNKLIYEKFAKSSVKNIFEVYNQKDEIIKRLKEIKNK